MFSFRRSFLTVLLTITATFAALMPISSASTFGIGSNHVFSEASKNVNYNGANLKEFKFTKFTYSPQNDAQRVTLTWKADRGHSFEIYISETNISSSKIYRGVRGTSLELDVPPNSTLRLALRAERFPNYQIPLAFESPLQLNNLLIAQLRSACKDKLSNVKDRAELWKVITNRKVTGLLGYFALVAPAFISTSPGSSLAEAIASTAVGTVTEILDPFQVPDFVRGVGALAEVNSYEYFQLSCGFRK
jgi:hypothetical protein